MTQSPPDLDRQLMLDANAVAGTLEQIFGRDVTASMAACFQCGNTAPIGTLHAFTRGPGVVLRCSVCDAVVLRFATTPQGIYLDLRGLSFLRMGDDGLSARP
jgi:hypothetical protein